MFVNARQIFDRAELWALGKRMAARKLRAKAPVRTIVAKGRDDHMVNVNGEGQYF